MAYDLAVLLKTMIEQEASDLHLTVGAPPAFRIHGQIVRSKAEPLRAEDTKRICLSLLTEQQRRHFEDRREIDFAIGVKGIARLRVNLFVQRGSVAGVFRRIPSRIPELGELGFGKQVETLLAKPHGLVLVTGATGSGKSTTIAALIDAINTRNRAHIITIEDPIEFTHRHKLSLVNQREVGADCESFATGLRQVLREDPDVILVGEMRDRDTSEAAIKAAETGHLVFSTLHTNGAIASINRVVQMFPLDAQEYIRTLLSFTLEGVLTQALCERADRRGRVLVYEYMAMTPAIRNLVRENKLHQAYGQMQIGQDKYGMVTMNQGLATLVQQGSITVAEALSHSPDSDELQTMLDKGSPHRRSA